MSINRMAVLFIAAFIASTVLLSAPPVSASSLTNLNLAAATVTGNLTTLTSAFGTTGLSLLQGVQVFNESALHCEAIYNSVSGLGGLGAGTGWFIGTAGGHRALFQNNPPQSPGVTHYLNFCANGYNESAQIHIRTLLYLDVSAGGGGIGGHIYIGFSSSASVTTVPICGPFVIISPVVNGNGQLTSIQTGVAFAGNSPQLTGSLVSISPSLPNKTWYQVDLWQNGSNHQDGSITGNGLSAHATSSIAWSVGTCGAAGLSNEVGTVLELAGVAQIPLGYTSIIAFDDTTIGSQGGTSPGVPPRSGYATFHSVVPPSVLNQITITAKIQPNAWNPSGVLFLTAPSGGVCPCYINNSVGGNLWTDATTHTTTSFGPATFSLNVTGVRAGQSVSIALRLNSTDGLSNTYISSVAIPGVQAWINPGQGTSSAASIQEGNWLGPLVAVVLVSSIAYAFFESFREGIELHRK